ncbi:hypothetical protein [Cohnella cholangitidis]|uniref:Uncharacterized protein n=1 Tax=Cohnella cholangitidis TaxID=2598458 RepID=A0A7G5C2J2_9BACL|nr:hypothetical protein [Cohnella cholangitidis]QMV43426.1 hypothetical protein FPL14_21300 [Cohnella cholangitidis]
MLHLDYREWSEALGRVEQGLLDIHVSPEELFMRKLVNATVIRNRMFEHTSNESENNREHTIYAKPFRDHEVDTFGPAIWKSAFEFVDVSRTFEPVFCVWHNGDFVVKQMMYGIAQPMDIARLLLDHYLIEYGRTYEVLYTLLDHERKKVLFFLKEVME